MRSREYRVHDARKQKDDGYPQHHQCDHAPHPVTVHALPKALFNILERDQVFTGCSPSGKQPVFSIANAEEGRISQPFLRPNFEFVEHSGIIPFPPLLVDMFGNEIESVAGQMPAAPDCLKYGTAITGRQKFTPDQQVFVGKAWGVKFRPAELTETFIDQFDLTLHAEFLCELLV